MNPGNLGINQGIFSTSVRQLEPLSSVSLKTLLDIEHIFFYLKIGISWAPVTYTTIWEAEIRRRVVPGQSGQKIVCRTLS
jgi:hypothetical protein